MTAENFRELAERIESALDNQEIINEFYEACKKKKTVAAYGQELKSVKEFTKDLWAQYLVRYNDLYNEFVVRLGMSEDSLERKFVAVMVLLSETDKETQGQDARIFKIASEATNAFREFEFDDTKIPEYMVAYLLGWRPDNVEPSNVNIHDYIHAQLLVINQIKISINHCITELEKKVLDFPTVYEVSDLASMCFNVMVACPVKSVDPSEPPTQNRTPRHITLWNPKRLDLWFHIQDCINGSTRANPVGNTFNYGIFFAAYNSHPNFRDDALVKVNVGIRYCKKCGGNANHLVVYFENDGHQKNGPRKPIKDKHKAGCPLYSVDKKLDQTNSYLLKHEAHYILESLRCTLVKGEFVKCTCEECQKSVKKLNPCAPANANNYFLEKFWGTTSRICPMCGNEIRNGSKTTLWLIEWQDFEGSRFNGYRDDETQMVDGVVGDHVEYVEHIEEIDEFYISSKEEQTRRVKEAYPECSDLEIEDKRQEAIEYIKNKLENRNHE